MKRVLWSLPLLLLAGLALPAHAGSEPQRPTGPLPTKTLIAPLSLPAGEGESLAAQKDLGQVPTAAEAAARVRALLASRLPALGESSAAGMTLAERSQASELASRIGRDVELATDPDSGAVMYLAGERLHPPADPSKHGPADKLATAMSFLSANRALLKLDDPRTEVRVIAEEADDLTGGLRLRFQQTFAGIDVWGSELSVYLDAAGHVEGLFGAYAPTPHRSPPAPTVSLERAERIARQSLDVTPDRAIREQQLVYYRPKAGAPRLAWKLVVDVALDDQRLVAVDAHAGLVLEQYNTVMTGQVAGSGIDLLGVTRPLTLWQTGPYYLLVNTAKPMYTGADPMAFSARGLLRVFQYAGPSSWSWIYSYSPFSWLSPAGVSAAFNTSAAYDYYSNVHGRASLDGAGVTISTVVGLPETNAYYKPSEKALYFGTGDRFAGSLDVVAHEMTHGVIDHTARLQYFLFSGALSEALADFFGEAAERYVTGWNDWIAGTSLLTLSRSMANPRLSGQPDHMSRFVLTIRDNAGVHINNGIVNRAFYLLAEGMPGAIGMSATERIVYRALTRYLLPPSGFIHARWAFTKAAQDLFGSSSPQVGAVAAAFNAVGIYSSQQSAPAPGSGAGSDASGEDAAVFLFYDTEASTYFLGRRETSLGDPEQGVYLNDHPAALTRLSVTGDGALLFFVNAEHDACFADTDTGEVNCIGVPGQVESVAMAKTGLRYAFVMRDGQGQPTDRITVIDLGGNSFVEIPLAVAAPDATEPIPVLRADAMEFFNDGRQIAYDGFSLVTLDSEQYGLWSLYIMDTLTGAVSPLTNASDPRWNTGYPTLAPGSDRLIAFDIYDVVENLTYVWAGDLETGDEAGVAYFSGAFSAPTYTTQGDAILFSAPDSSAPTGRSVWKSTLAADQITPTGDPTLWLWDANFAAPYRRGPYSPNATDCGDPTNALCLNRSRFRVEAYWETASGDLGGGRAVPLTSDTGYQWFFGDTNVELVVKVLDACALNQSYWVFAAGLTNVRVTMVVTDTVTGSFKVYENPQGTEFVPIQDTGSFKVCGYSKSTTLADGTTAPREGVEPVFLRPRRAPVAAKSSGACGDPNALCLQDGRFAVTTNWRTAAGQTGAGRPVTLTRDTGYFWFFDASNIEMVLKVLDGCGLNSKFWVFAGGLTNVEVDLEVRDTLTGEVATYRNPLNQPFLPIQDTSALNCTQ
ncbi:MAG: M4 family metallopeptidase [Thermoanaerobaculia bacterium]|nr:M4 family metallopeptidase [Thermoanaerobaculia bacterium]